MTQETTIEAPDTEAPPPATEPEAPPAESETPAEPQTPEQVAAREAEQRKTDRIARATAAEKAAAEAREIRRADRAREEAKRARDEARREREAYEAKQKEDAEAIRKGGLSALKARTGLEYRELTKEWIDQSSPEGQERARIAKMLEDQQAKIAKFEEAQQRALVDESFRALDAVLEEKAEEFPYAYDMSRRMFRAAVPIIAQSLINQGRQPTQSAVLKLLDESEKPEHDERENRRAARQARSKPKPSNGVTQQPSSPNASRAVRTLTSQDGSERARERGDKTAAELDDEILANLKQMMRGT